MTNVNSQNEEVKKQFKYILNNHPALSGVMIYEFDLENNKIQIAEITNDLYGNNVIVNNNGEYAIVTIDFIRQKILIKHLKLPYQKIFDNHPRKCIIPNGYEYKKENRTIFRKCLVRLNPGYSNKNILIFKENDLEYNINIISNKKDFEINDFIDKLLNYNKKIANIRDLLTAINGIIDLAYFELKIMDSFGSDIEIHYAMLSKYREYQDMENESRKIYLKNDEFFVEKRIKEKYDEDDITPFMKKLGVYNGKEK